MLLINVYRLTDLTGHSLEDAILIGPRDRVDINHIEATWDAHHAVLFVTNALDGEPTYYYFIHTQEGSLHYHVDEENRQVENNQMDVKMKSFLLCLSRRLMQRNTTRSRLRECIEIAQETFADKGYTRYEEALLPLLDAIVLSEGENMYWYYGYETALIEQMKMETERVILHDMYRPGGVGYLQALESFTTASIRA